MKFLAWRCSDQVASRLDGSGGGGGGEMKGSLERGMPPFDHLRSLEIRNTPGMPPRPSDNVPVLDKK